MGTSAFLISEIRESNDFVLHLIYEIIVLDNFFCGYGVPGSAPGCRTGNREKLSSTQAEPVQAIKSGVAYFPSISFTTSWRRSRYSTDKTRT